MNIKDQLLTHLENIKLQILKEEAHPHTLLIWGAGNTASLYQNCFLKNQINPEYYIDSDVKKQRELFYGKLVISPEKRENIKNPFILIASQNINFTNEIKKQLTAVSYPVFTVDEYIFAKNIERIQRVIQLLSDERSRYVYCSMILNRIMNTLPKEEIFEGEQYYAIMPFKRVSNNEVFIDMGAFVGEGIEKHVFYRSGRFCKIIAFEPDKGNYVAMCRRVSRLNQEWGLPENKIECVSAGVGDATTSLMFYSELGVASKFISKELNNKIEKNMTKIYALDDFMGERNISFLKADIESYELNMLQGARKIIIRDRPNIAISIYHSPSDMYEIIEYLADLSIGYTFAVRQHSAELDDTVLYAHI